MKRIMFLAFIGVTVFFHAANANQGIKDNEVVLCQAAPYSGLLAAANSESTSGARAYFEWVNKKGGVSGRKIRLETRDDKQDPKLTLELTQQLVDKGCFALFMYRTSPSLQAILPLVNSQSIPLVAPQVGPQFLYDDTNKTIFNIRASYREEVTRAIEQLVSTGISRIALVHATDAFGQEGVAGVDEARKKFKFDIVGKQALDNRSPEVQAAVDMIVSTAPQASL
ncbi:MAG: ABC transporter substrate-binding protein, partial [Burkholderiales bacterium]